MQQKARLPGGLFVSSALSFPTFLRKRDEGFFSSEHTSIGINIIFGLNEPCRLICCLATKGRMGVFIDES
jgi:hypothetical protein